MGYKKIFFTFYFYALLLCFCEENRIDLKPLEKYEDIPEQTNKQKPKLLDSKQKSAKIFYFETITLRNCTVLSNKVQKSLVVPFLKKKISLNDLNRLIITIHQAYSESGYILEDVYFKKNSFRGKNLDLFVVEPKVSGLKISEARCNNRRVNSLLKLNEKDVLKLTDLQCAFDILNEQETMLYDLTLNTNSQRTCWEAEVKLKEYKKCILGLAYDNYGSKDFGRDQITLSTRLEDVLGMFEQWHFMYKTTTNSFDTKRYSKQGLISLSIPYRRWRTSFYSVFEKNKGNILTMKRHSEQILLGVDLRYAFSRTWNSGTYAGATLEHYSKQYYLDTRWIFVQSGDVTKLVLWGSHYRYIFGGVIYGKLSYSQGIHASDAGIGQLFDKNFKKLNIDGFFQKGFGNRLKWILSGNAQVGEPDLFNHEKFSLGSMSTIRGFVDTQYTSDSGYFVRNELECLLFNQCKARFFIGYDYGHLKPSKVDRVEEKTLQSICCGVRMNVKDVKFEMLMARPIHTIKSNRYTLLFGIKGNF